MTNFVTADDLREIMASHKQSVAQMAVAASQMGSAGIRSVQLWMMAAALDPETAEAAGAAFAVKAAAQWEANKTSIVAGLDATAAGMGVTRQTLLDEIAAAPATSFG